MIRHERVEIGGVAVCRGDRYPWPCEWAACDECGCLTKFGRHAPDCSSAQRQSEAPAPAG